MLEISRLYRTFLVTLKSMHRFLQISGSMSAYLIICGISIGAVGQEQIAMPDGIELLQTGKVEFERIAGPPRSGANDFSYMIDGMKIEAEFASERCIWHGWNVEPGTLLSLTLYPKSRTPVDQKLFLTMGYEVYVDDTFTQILWSNLEGRQFEIGSDGNLLRAKFLPSGKHAPMRCKGFPSFSIASGLYSSERSGQPINFDSWDVGLLGDFAFKLKETQDLKGYVFIYFTNGKYSGALKLEARIRKYLTSTLGLQLHQFEVRLGGLRDENSVETLLIFNTQSPPEPRPKYPSGKLFSSIVLPRN